MLARRNFDHLGIRLDDLFPHSGHKSSKGRIRPPTCPYLPAVRPALRAGPLVPALLALLRGAVAARARAVAGLDLGGQLLELLGERGAEALELGDLALLGQAEEGE